MRIETFGVMFAVVCLGAANCMGQAPAVIPAQNAAQPNAAAKSSATKQKPTSASANRGLSIETVKVPSELAQTFAFPLKCDADGSLFFRTSPDGFDAIHKLSPKGERLAVFQPNSPDVKVDHAEYFSIGPDGDIYQIIIAHEIKRYVFEYKGDGTVKSEIKLQPGFAFFPSRLAVFPSGDLLVAGLEYDKDRTAAMWPFTGIFSSDGTLRKELTLEDDERIRDMAASGDPKVTSPQNPSFNHAVTQGSAEVGQDGNVYLLRRLSPAIVYVISAGGGVVRRFTVDPGQEDFMPVIMHIAGSRMAVLFRQEQTRKEIIKVVDLEGREIATYDEPVKDGRQALGMAFICYASNPERFTFLTTMEDDKLGLVIAQPQ